MTERSKFRPSPTRSWREKKKEGCVSNDWNRASIELVYVRYQDEPSPQYRGRPRRTNDHAASRVKHLPHLPILQVKRDKIPPPSFPSRTVRGGHKNRLGLARRDSSRRDHQSRLDSDTELSWTPSESAETHTHRIATDFLAGSPFVDSECGNVSMPARPWGRLRGFIYY